LTVFLLKNDKGELTDLHILSDEGKMLENCKKGKIFRVKRDSYPTSIKERISARKRAEARVGELSYKASLNNCEHFVTEVLTGKATCRQLDCTGLKIFAVTLDQVNEKTVRFILKTFFDGPEEIMGLLKSIPGKVKSLKFSDIKTCLHEVAQQFFSICSSLLSEMKQMIKTQSFAEIKKIANSLISTAFDELVEFWKTKTVSAMAKDIRGIAERSNINLKSAALLELAFLTIFTIGDLFLYMCGRKNARIVAQCFLQRVTGAIGTCLGTYFGGFILGVRKHWGRNHRWNTC